MGRIKGSKHKPATHCKRGHEFTPENTWVSPKGNKRSCRECMCLYRNTDKGKTIKMHAKLRAHGWTPELHAAVALEQDNKCWICGKEACTEMHGVLSADHKHTVPPKPRGLLCVCCNLGLGAFKDSPDFLIKALEYLKKYGE